MKQRELNEHIYRLSFLYTLRISEAGISASYDLRTHHLEWHEITAVRPNHKGGGLLLSNSGEDTVIFLNPNLHEYSEIVKIIQEKRPDLWRAQDIQTFHYNPLGKMVFGISGLATILFAFLYFSDREGGVYLTIFGVGVGLIMLWYAFTSPQKLFFQGDSIVFEYVAWKNQIPAKEIDSIRTERQVALKIGRKSFMVTIQAPFIKCRNGKTINLGNVIEDTPVLLNALEKREKLHLRHPDS